MDIRQLHYFLVLCDEMNYSRAAQRLFSCRGRRCARASLRWKRKFAGRCLSVPTTSSPLPTAA